MANDSQPRRAQFDAESVDVMQKTVDVQCFAIQSVKARGAGAALVIKHALKVRRERFGDWPQVAVVIAWSATNE
jgi:hypothetical protein